MTDPHEGTTLYLTAVECERGHETTFAHEGPTVALDRSPPWPEAEHCPTCLTRYDYDRDFVEQHEAKRTMPERADSDEVFEEALRLWGEDVQRDMVVEECGEAIIANQHRKRGRVTREEMIEEFVDVHILMEQMRVTYAPQYEEIYDHKMARLAERVENADGDGMDEIVGGDDGDV